jgi:hypothetical protein
VLLAIASEPSPGRERAPAVGQRACFGGVPETAASELSEPMQLRVVDGDLYFGGELQRLNGGTKVKLVRGYNYLGPIDAGQVFGLTSHNEIVSVDFRTRTARLLVASRLSSAEGLVQTYAPFELDERYLYYVRSGPSLYDLQGGPPGRPDNATGLCRVPRDGSGPPEFLGAPPAPGWIFAIDGGFVYYRGSTPENQAAIVRRALRPNASVEVVVRLQNPHPGGVLRIFDGRLYYIDDDSIWSVSIPAQTPPVRHVAIGPSDTTDLLAEPGCLYWANRRTIKRAVLGAGGSGIPDVIADEQTYTQALGPSEVAGRLLLATDGRFLYWPDAAGERIMRVRRDPRPQRPRADPIASWIVGDSRAPMSRAAAFDMPPGPGSAWDASCRIHFDCERPTPPLPACPADTPAEVWSRLVGRAPALVGRTVSVRGPLVLGARARAPRGVRWSLIQQRMTRCGPSECCNHARQPVVIGGVEEQLALASIECSGDDSRVCCNAPAFGQTVIATGVLEGGPTGGWMLTGRRETWPWRAAPDLCVDAHRPDGRAR